MPEQGLGCAGDYAKPRSSPLKRAGAFVRLSETRGNQARSPVDKKYSWKLGTPSWIPPTVPPSNAIVKSGRGPGHPLPKSTHQGRSVVCTTCMSLLSSSGPSSRSHFPTHPRTGQAPQVRPQPPGTLPTLPAVPIEWKSTCLAGHQRGSSRRRSIGSSHHSAAAAWAPVLHRPPFPRRPRHLNHRPACRVNGTERCPVFGKIRCPIFCTSRDSNPGGYPETALPSSSFTATLSIPALRLLLSR